MRTVFRLVFVAGLFAAPVSAEDADVPLRNWTVPPYTASSSGGIHAMTDATPPRVFVGVVPCRVADTRGNGAPIQGGIFANSEQRDWTVWGVCGIPVGANAISVNFTVVSAPATPQGGFLLAWPTGSPPANPVAIMTYGPGVTVISNAAIVPLSAGVGQLTVNVSHSTHVIMDVNGYFAPAVQDAGTTGLILQTSTNPTAWLNNMTPACTQGCALRADTSGGNAINARVFNTSGSTTNGVWAEVRSTGQNSTGVLGVSQATTGLTYGVLGQSFSTQFGAAGVTGFASGAGSGVYGLNSNTVDGAAGVRGQAGTFFTIPGYQVAGVRGEGSYFGVLGISPFLGTAGSLVSNGAEVAWGALGHTTGLNTNWGVYAHGNIGASGVKSFIDPHPTDATKVIRYISLEGPEPGTYFRGRGKFERGIARIAVPEDFRLVTDADGLTVQVTPIGGMAAVGVLKADLNEIVVQSSRNLEFYYMVNGIRRTYKQLTSPISEGQEFLPRSADAKIPAYLSNEQKRLLIQNGTYNPDGTVNMETARRLGWNEVWEERSRPSPQSTEP